MHVFISPWKSFKNVSGFILSFVLWLLSLQQLDQNTYKAVSISVGHFWCIYYDL